MSNFASSSQRARWLFSSLASLHDARRQALGPRDGESEEEFAKRLQDEDIVLQHFCVMIQQCCGDEDDHHIKRERKVQATATVFFRRFYLKNSILDFDPRVIMLACLFLAGKVEEGFIKTSELSEKLGGSEDDLLRLEMKVLEELQFDVRVYHPQGCLESILMDYCAASELGPKVRPVLALSGEKDPTPPGTLSSSLIECLKRATETLKVLQVTDMCLLSTPGYLALAVLSVEAGEDSELSTFISQRYGIRNSEEFRATMTLVLQRLEQAKEAPVDGEYRKAMKGLSKKSSWKREKTKKEK